MAVVLCLKGVIRPSLGLYGGRERGPSMSQILQGNLNCFCDEMITPWSVMALSVWVTTFFVTNSSLCVRSTIHKVSFNQSQPLNVQTPDTLHASWLFSVLTFLSVGDKPLADTATAGKFKVTLWLVYINMMCTCLQASSRSGCEDPETFEKCCKANMKVTFYSLFIHLSGLQALSFYVGRPP